MERVARHDPGNEHGVIYMWGTNGLGYNEKKVQELMPDAPLDSWRLVFDPAVASKIAKCGISVLDSPAEMVRVALSYLGRDPNSQKPEDLAAAEDTLLKIRPYIRNINSSEYIEALANGDLCVAVGYNGDILQARDRAREANKGIEVGLHGAQGRLDPVVRHAGHPEGCAAPRQRATHTSTTSWTPKSSPRSPISSASPTRIWSRSPFVQDSVKQDQGIYPPPALREKLAVQLADSPEQTRAITRMWQKFKTGQ